MDVENVETTYFDNCHFFPVLASFNFCYNFVSSILVLLLSHSVELTSPSSLVCSLFYSVGVISLNIATPSERRLKFVL